jgi:hypothetical protein
MQWQYRESAVERMVETSGQYTQLQQELEEHKQIIVAKSNEIMKIQMEKRELQAKVKELTLHHTEERSERRRALSAKPTTHKVGHNHLVTVSSTLIPSIEERVSLRVQILELKQQNREKDTEIQNLQLFVESNTCSACVSKKKVFRLRQRSVGPVETNKPEQEMKLHEKILMRARIKELEEELFQVYQELDEANDTVLEWMEFSNELESRNTVNPADMKAFQLAFEDKNCFSKPAFDEERLHNVRPPFQEAGEQENQKLRKELDLVRRKVVLLETNTADLEQAKKDLSQLQGMMLEMDEQYQKEWEEELRYRDDLLKEIHTLKLQVGGKPILSRPQSRRSSVANRHSISHIEKDRKELKLPDANQQPNQSDSLIDKAHEMGTIPSLMEYPHPEATTTKPIIESSTRRQSVMERDSNVLPKSSSMVHHAVIPAAEKSLVPSRRPSFDVHLNENTSPRHSTTHTSSRKSSFIGHSRRPSVDIQVVDSVQRKHDTTHPPTSRKSSLIQATVPSRRPSIKIIPIESQEQLCRKSVYLDQNYATKEMNDGNIDFINESLDQLNQSVQMVKQETAIHKMEQHLLETTTELESFKMKLETTKQVMETKESQLCSSSQLIEELMEKLNEQTNKLERIEDEIRQKDLQLEQRSLELQSEQENTIRLQTEVSKLKQHLTIDLQHEEKEDMDLFSMETMLKKELEEGRLSFPEYASRIQMLQDLKQKQDRLLIVSRKFKDQLHEMADQFAKRMDLSSIRGLEHSYGIYSHKALENTTAMDYTGFSDSAISTIVPLKKKLAKALALNKELELKLELAHSLEKEAFMECRHCTQLKSHMRTIGWQEETDLMETMEGILNEYERWRSEHNVRLQLQGNNDVLVRKCEKLESKVSKLIAKNKRLSKRASRTGAQSSRNSLNRLVHLSCSLSSNTSDSNKIDQSTLTDSNSLDDLERRRHEVAPLTSRIHELEFTLKEYEKEMITQKEYIDEQILQITDLESKKKALEEETLKACELLNQYQSRETQLNVELSQHKVIASEAFEMNRSLEEKLRAKIMQLQEQDQEIQHLIQSRRSLELLLEKESGAEREAQTDISMFEVFELEKKAEKCEEIYTLQNTLQLELSLKTEKLLENEKLHEEWLTEQRNWEAKKKELSDTLSHLQLDLSTQKHYYEAKQADLLAELKKLTHTHSKLKKQASVATAKQLEQNKKLNKILQGAHQWYARVVGSVPPGNLHSMFKKLENKITETEKALVMERELSKNHQMRIQMLSENEKDLLTKLRSLEKDKLELTSANVSLNHSMTSEQMMLDEMKVVHDALKKWLEHAHNHHLEDSVLQMIQELISSQKEIVKDIIKRSQRDMDILSKENFHDEGNLEYRAKYSKVRSQIHAIVIIMENLFQNTLGKSVFAKSKVEEMER